MTRHERFEATMAHRQPDRPPVDLVVTPDVRERLAAALGTEDVLGALQVDVRHVWAKPTSPELAEHPQMRLSQPETHGFYQDTASHPLADIATAADVAVFQPLRTPQWYDFSGIREDACRLRDAGYVTVFGSAGILDVVNGLGSRGIGYERMICDLLVADPVAVALVDKAVAADLEFCRRGLEAAGGAIDILYIGEDCGTQQGPLFPPAFFREFFVPRMRPFAELAHAHGAYLKLHSCGSTRSLLPVFIDEIGIDILDAVQPEPVGMEPEGLKRDFGERITFCGMLSLQHTFARGTPEQCRAEARRRIDTIGRDGGYIFGPPNTFTADIPIENILAAYDEVLAGS